MKIKKKFKNNKFIWWYEPDEKELYLPELQKMNVKLDEKFYSTKFLKIPEKYEIKALEPQKNMWQKWKKEMGLQEYEEIEF